MSYTPEVQKAFLSYLDNQARLNNTIRTDDKLQFTVDPSVQQKIEKAVMEHHPFLKEINSFGVTEQKGETILIAVNKPIASRNTSTSDRREPQSVNDLNANRYSCEQTNFDTMIPYTQLDAWAGHPEFQNLINQQILQREALDRLMIGFNGEKCELKSDRLANPLLQDVNIGWLQLMRDRAPQRVMKGVTLTSRDEDGKIITKGQYANIDAVVYDAVNSLIDPWHRNAAGLVAIVGRQLVTQKNFKVINQHSQQNPNMELLAGNELLKLSSVGGIPSVQVPYLPDGAVFITTMKNLSLYWQKGKLTRFIKNEPEYNRIATYAQSNDGYAVEDYGLACLIEGVTFAGAESGE
ncbi:phage major capsid protein, P2 family [Shewanella sp.]|uniref:phage major capsid protein, P2 family n=1 Tax=Gammaproteobacteria TaxID=1236 RepID=UPI001B508CF5|nr:phage major capsid protein, P2 family [Shewanella sp.]MBP6518331.1 phage major capsid protein, P2 family [Shewanella sp.]